MTQEQISDMQIRSALTQALSYCRFGHFDYIVSYSDVPKITEMLTKALVKEAKHHKESRELIPLIATLIGEGMNAVAHDSFNECFESPRKERRSILYFPLLVIQALISLVFLLPIRALIFFGSTLLFGFLISFTKLIYPFDNDFRQKLLLKFYQMAAKGYVISFGGDIHIHGQPPKYQPGMLFVSNHTTTIEVASLSSILPFGIVGYAHKGIQGIVEKYICSPVQPLLFERKDKSQRQHIADEMKQHVFDPKVRSPLLIFPEGVCVNNKFVTQFKQGAFSIGAKVCPIAIKYRDCSPLAYHNSKEKSFPRYLLGIFMYQSLACDIWFLPPQEIEKDETAAEFAHRVYMLIAKTAGLIPRQWDGFLKYADVNQKMIDQRKIEFAKVLGIAEFGNDDEHSSMSIHVSQAENE